MKVNGRGQVTIPADLRDKYGLVPGTQADFVDHGDGILLTRRPSGVERAEALRGSIRLKHERGVDDYIERIRGR